MSYCSTGRSLACSGTSHSRAIERSPGLATKFAGILGGSRLITGWAGPPEDGTGVAVAGMNGGVNGGGAGAAVGTGVDAGSSYRTVIESNPTTGTSNPDSYRPVASVPAVRNDSVSSPKPMRFTANCITAPSVPDMPPGLLQINADA